MTAYKRIDKENRHLKSELSKSESTFNDLKKKCTMLKIKLEL